MKTVIFISLLCVCFVISVQSKKHKWKHFDKKVQKGHSKIFKNKKDALPYSSPFARPYKWNMYSDGPYGWGGSKKRRDIDSFGKFKRDLYQRNIVRPFRQPASYYHPYKPALQPYQAPQARSNIQQYNNNNYQPFQPAPHPYQAPQTRNGVNAPAQPYQPYPQNTGTVGQPGAYYQPYNYQPAGQQQAYLQKQAPEVQQPKERTWVDKMGVRWTTRKVNDYKWGEREPGIMMDQYAGGPFGFDDVRRNKIMQPRHQWDRRSSIPHPRTWVDKHGIRWTTGKVNDYAWGEREPGVVMDEYNGGPYGWMKRNQILRRPADINNMSASKRNRMFMEKP